MNKKMYYLLFLFVGLGLSFTSCLSDDDNSSDVDEVWRYQQDTIFNNVKKDKEFHELLSESRNGSVYWEKSTEIINSDILSRTTTEGKPEFTDTVVVRYEGWFLNAAEDNKKYIFDSTENPSMSSSGVNPNKISRQFAVNQVIDGWTTVLQDMTVGEERLVVIPQQLGYGSTTQTNTSGVVTIPAYTTLWFRVKLLKIIPMKTIVP